MVTSDFATDLFIDSPGTDLAAHTADLGGPWTYYGGSFRLSGTGNWYGYSSDVNSEAKAIMSAVPPIPDYTVQCTSPGNGVQNNITRFGIIGRFIDVNNYWAAYYDSYSASLFLFKVVAGVRTNIGNGGGDLVPNNTLGIRFTGNLCELLENGIVILSANESSLSRAGRVGLYSGEATGPGIAGFHDFGELHAFTVTPGAVSSPTDPIAPVPGTSTWNRHRCRGECESYRLLETPESALGHLLMMRNGYMAMAPDTVFIAAVGDQSPPIQRLRQQYSWRVGLL